MQLIEQIILAINYALGPILHGGSSELSLLQLRLGLL